MQADVLGDAFATALKLAAARSSENMRITVPMLLMASPGYGEWTRYLPRNPGFT
jgi:hypothetical protein